MKSIKVKEADKHELIFALDIGTKTVIGVVGYYKDEIFHIVDSELVEHKKRSMYDGQIHNIQEVADVVNGVKESLEERLSVKFTKVAIAAAGRALKTYKQRVDTDIDITIKIDNRMIESLEMEAIQKAQEVLEGQQDKKEPTYYCVGYTVVKYYLDDNFIDNLEGHSGNKIGAEVIATFLPHVVVDSLYTVMARVGLEVMNLTLEPIAAINVAIKKDLRLLNLCLVDIGAGTSDIAITRDGAVVAYGMVSIAGDEITENIAKKYLVGYDMAEKIKVNLCKEAKHKFCDIVGIPYELSSDEILDAVDSSLEKLGKGIAEKILECNEKSPSAVLMIGGGSQIPRLNEYVAKYLDLPKERVVTKNAEIIENVEGIYDVLKGPQGITPIGIGLTAALSRYKDFLEVTVNGMGIKLFNSKRIKVSDALVLIGYNPRKLIPKRGDDFTYYYNGEERVIKGSVGKPAEILVNGNKASLETVLEDDDKIIVEDAISGFKPEPFIDDVVKRNHIYLNGEKIDLVETVKVNGSLIHNNILLNEHDEVQVKEIVTLKELINRHDIDVRDYQIYVNDQWTKDCYLKNGDQVITEKIVKMEKRIDLLVNGKTMNINHEKDAFRFVDIFDYVDIDLKKPHGKLVLNLNGRKAEFTAELESGDKLEVYWDKEK